MKRIDSVNARPDANGAGKPGFHDNADAPGQDATYVNPSWCNAIQEELANAIEGFGQPLSPSNNAQLFTVLFALAGRIQLLENKVYEDVRVGSVFITTIPFANSPAVRAHKGYGRWQRLGDGHALVTRALDGNPIAPGWMFELGGTGGEYKHLQTLDELVGHKHGQAPFDKFGSIAAETTQGTPASFDSKEVWSEYACGWMSSADWFNATEKFVGGNQPFNVVQPSLVVDVWLRLPDEPNELEPTYAITANRATMLTGETVIFTLDTTNLNLGATVAWQIIGVSGDDIQPSNLFGSFVVNASGRATYTVKAINQGSLTFSLVNVPNKFVTVEIEQSSEPESPYDKYPVAEWFYQSGSQYIQLRDNTTIDSRESHVTDYNRKLTSLLTTQIYACIHVIKTLDATITEETYQLPVVTDYKGLVVTQLINNIGNTDLVAGETMSIYIGYYTEEQNPIQIPLQPEGTIGGIIHEFHFE
ncbi:hypothetical protein MMP61_18120 [Acinetobacter sp. NIPH 1958]|uniref:phage baseplate protein n=1 Tax=Acinetobacter sp. NIPH 1958 TaxID=2923430 RepID=UPI001F4A905D|nr:hypothetical protein [Acinetobacter sp. NIPH 1958]MCH7357461.1 hypothetical protein [Acinetobacter sp. NIPH 1958]